MTDNVDKEAYKERLQAGVWHYCNQIVEEEGEALHVAATPQFISALADLVYAQAESMSLDLEGFAAHAKRSVINTEDVKLCCRRNDGLVESIQEFIEALERRKRLEKERQEGRTGGSRGGRGRGRGMGR